MAAVASVRAAVVSCVRRLPQARALWAYEPDSKGCGVDPANLAEACGRRGDKEFGRFVRIAMGSASEADYLILLASDLGYLPQRTSIDFRRELDEIRRMLTGLDKRLQNQSLSTTVGERS